ncbi:cysteine--tRNA ligase, cytoplasmic-like [Schistocerca gregaria]|uniref:cysteine--tRNA ligase, cytoplasmic-like n=1 Tax=Schistocerca gregaria TaxID=7010 RepID=UPI00211E5FCC|nr:cysteine--tRNA ligase, cytoplasmic-like [Schistocerca gregaria]
MENELKESQTRDWFPPQGEYRTGLRVYNSLTRKKDEFVPTKGKQVKWYVCGPTVYDSAHLGHARTYLGLDIIRRILEGYFGYDMQVCMNITDVDDKIIAKSRRVYLYEQYEREGKRDGDAELLLEAMRGRIEELKKQCERCKEDVKSGRRNEKEAKPEWEFYEGRLKKVMELEERLIETKKMGAEAAEATDGLRKEGQDVLSEHLDKLYGQTISHVKMKEITSRHAKKYEREFMRDMESLGVKRPDVLTRVSEYMDEIIEMCLRLIEKGFAYESGGSVYFDIAAYESSPSHVYAKLMPSAVGNDRLLEEGEGMLGSTGKKKSTRDFALWKKAKPGEPGWESPWGLGRPGWHIECSAMASKILGGVLDIHAGGVDLMFPHHDNELAQSEAYHGHGQWVNYFLHAGHLHIDNLKMSKSLKNFITIEEVLSQYPARQLRMLFLIQPWDHPMNYQRDDPMREVRTIEKTLREFFMKVEAVVDVWDSNEVQQTLNDEPEKAGIPEFWTSRDWELNQAILTAQELVHASLCNNFDTPSVLRHLLHLISQCNIYLEQNAQKKALLLTKAASYVVRIFSVLGIALDPGSLGRESEPQQHVISKKQQESIARPYVAALVQFRKKIRSFVFDPSFSSVDHAALRRSLLSITDELRDTVMPELNVEIVDDKDFDFFFVSKEQAQNERQLKQLESQCLKLSSQLSKQKKELEKLTEISKPLSEWFQEKYGLAIEEQGSTYKLLQPELVDKLSKSKKKEMDKLAKKHQEAHQRYLEKSSVEGDLLQNLRDSVEALTKQLNDISTKKAL